MEVRKLTNDRIDNSSVNIGDGNKFEKDTAIGSGATIIKDSTIIHNSNLIHDNTLRYEVPSNENILIENIAKLLINNLGLKKSAILDVVIFLIGGLGFFSNYFFTSGYTTFFIIGVVLLIVGIFIAYSLFYYKNSICEKCGKEFAYREYKPRFREDVSDQDVTHRKEKAYFKCKFCGHKTERTYFDKIDKRNQY